MATLALADRPAPSYNRPAPSYAPRPSYHEPVYKAAPAQYSYAYDVNDHYVNFGHNEDRSGYSTNGKYYVQLPDGRLQTVTYSVDGDSGYIANVQYSGEPQYPKYEPKPAYKPAPSYKPAPVYRPAPRYNA